MTFRAIETLKSCDYILCEDTRHSRILLNHYSIEKQLISFHKFSESSKENRIIEDLKAGKNIALISDAGTPGISDPGSQLVAECKEQDIEVISIPGACAAIAALTCSGLNTDMFQFLGFIPRKAGERRSFFQDVLRYKGTSICYESPNRLIESLGTINELAPDRLVVIARELTKKFEEVRRGTAQELINRWEDEEVRGEIVLLVAGEVKGVVESDWTNLSPEEHVALMETQYNLTKNEAIKMVAQIRGVAKREIYKSTIKD